MKLNSKLTLSYAVLACIACTLSAADNTKINTLIISGDDVDAHPWIKTQAEYRQMLLDSGKFDVRISEDMNILESAKALAKYDLIGVLKMVPAMPPAHTFLMSLFRIKIILSPKTWIHSRLMMNFTPPW